MAESSSLELPVTAIPAQPGSLKAGGWDIELELDLVVMDVSRADMASTRSLRLATTILPFYWPLDEL